MITQPPIITLLTDFGENDSYVGAMKGVMLGIAPTARLIDITHQVQPQSISQAAGLLSNVYKYYPPHTVHMIVVDPGVGSARQPIALETPHGRFVAPNNGVLTHVFIREAEWKAVALTNEDYWLPDPSRTFHGRDIFSPASAHLANGVALEELGERIDSLQTIHIPPLKIVPGGVKGEVVRIDHFGNVITNIEALQWLDEETLQFVSDTGGTDEVFRFTAGTAKVTFSWRTLEGIKPTYTSVDTGDTVALVGSGGELEISVNQGNAAEKLAIEVGDAVTLLFDKLG